MASTAIVFNADDLGYSTWRDAGIFHAFQQGIVTSASLLVNGASAASAAQHAMSIGLDIGIHLNLTEGVPLTPPHLLSHLLDSDQKLRYKTSFWKNCMTADPEFYQQVILETTAQIQKFKTLTNGISATHVDGHQHVHIAPGIANALAPIFQQHGIKTTRIPDENIQALTWISQETRTRLSGRIKSAKLSRIIYEKYGIIAPDRFLGQGCAGNHMSVSRIIGLTHRQLPVNTSTSTSTANSSSNISFTSSSIITAECMVHPGGDILGSNRPSDTIGGCGDGIVDAFAVSPDRQHELKILCNPLLKKKLSNNDNKLILCTWKQIYQYHQHRMQHSNTTMTPDTRTRVLLLAIGLEASGNYITALRLRSNLCNLCNFHVTLIDTNETTIESLEETIQRNKIQIAIGLHAYHAGKLLFTGSNLLSIPMIIVAGGTDLNEKVTSNVNRITVVENSIQKADAIVVFNKALGVRGTSILELLNKNKNTKRDKKEEQDEKNEKNEQNEQNEQKKQQKQQKQQQTPVLLPLPPSSSSLSTMSAPQTNPSSMHSKIFVIPQAVNVSNVSNSWLRSYLNMTSNDVLILMPSGIRPVKDPLFLVPLFLKWQQSQQKKSTTRNVKLVIVGAVRDQNVMNELSKIVTETIQGKTTNNTANNGSNINTNYGYNEGLWDPETHSIVYHPPIERDLLLAAIAESDVILNTSKSEGMANVLLESMALGIPILARRNEGNVSLVGANDERGSLFTTAKECLDIIIQGWCAAAEEDEKEKKDKETNDVYKSYQTIISNRAEVALEFIKRNHSDEKEAKMYGDVVHTVLSATE